MADGLLSLLNRLLPFATPGTPLFQDLLHLAALCTLLYFAPQIQQRLRASNGDDHVGLEADVDNMDTGALDTDHEIANDDRQVNEPGRAVNEVQDGPAFEGDREVFDHDGPLHEDQPGPPAPGDIPAQRNVGAKKAKSLARRDQRRAYNEFMRSQGDAQRARDAEGAAEREAALMTQRGRRKAAEVALETKRRKERDQRREQEESEWIKEMRRRELALDLVRDGLDTSKTCDLFKISRQIGDDVDEEWVEEILRASGTLGRKEDTVTMLTSTGWAVRVSEMDMAKLYTTAVEDGMGDGQGRIDSMELGTMLETVISR